jgi:hypothetical protein
MGGLLTSEVLPPLLFLRSVMADAPPSWRRGTRNLRANVCRPRLYSKVLVLPTLPPPSLVPVPPSLLAAAAAAEEVEEEEEEAVAGVVVVVVEEEGDDEEEE